MPIFEYACRQCGHGFETLVRSDTVPQCPHCQSQELDKQLSVFATSTDAPSELPSMPAACGGCSHGSCGIH